MSPAARLAAAIEVLDRIAAEAAPADGVLKAWGRDHRFAGSGDRRAIAERVYQALRGQARARAWLGEDGRALVLNSLVAEAAELDSLFTGEGHGPAPLTAKERASLAAPPADWPDYAQAGVQPFVAEALKARFGADWIAEGEALTQHRAPLDLRVNALRGGMEAALRLLAQEDFKAEPTPWSAWGLRLPAGQSRDIQQSRAWKTGWVEVQDEASQVAAAIAGAQPGMTVVDYCAGGGGKTLALAAAMKGKGRLIACDVHAKRMSALPERLERAGAKAEARRMGLEGQGTEDLLAKADLVFVDAPCSGSGTWRRHPEGAWRLTPETVARLSELQAAIVARAANLVKPGGRLLYATCSVLAQENEATASAFAQSHPEFRPLMVAAALDTPALTDAGRQRLAELADGGHTLQLTPRRAGTDGFFLALFERTP
jgi:16S rRNA (cytosine967-C5)-methyltransferase